ncbi:MAG: HlyD family efflux transporter periplasmic adaptor subunit [Clostridiaceae bacterium]|nr:HlyD family efflux transporter periplasmic adaptor subunit [Clostridiaceae bacterium]
MKRFGKAVAVTIILLLSAACAEKEEQNIVIPASSNIEINTKVEAIGTVDVRNIKNIFVDYPAIVEKIHIKDGSCVKKGDLLVSLDLSQFNKQIRDKEYELNSAKLELSKYQADVDDIKKSISDNKRHLDNNTDPELMKLVNDMKFAKDSYNKALENLEKKSSLLDLGIITRNDFEDFKEDVDKQKKALEDAEVALKIARHNKQKEIDELQSMLNQKMNNTSGLNSIDLLKNKISGIEADINIMKSKLNKSYISEKNIVSDVVNGVIYNLGYVEGDLVNGSKKVLSILDTDSIFIKANVDEEFIKDVKVGANATIIPIADKSKEYKGIVVNILGNAIEKNEETSVPVEIEIQNKDDFLVPNFNVDVEIETEGK